jgi:hypothetical protein
MPATKGCRFFCALPKAATIGRALVPTVLRGNALPRSSCLAVDSRKCIPRRGLRRNPIADPENPSARANQRTILLVYLGITGPRPRGSAAIWPAERFGNEILADPLVRSWKTVRIGPVASETAVLSASHRDSRNLGLGPTRMWSFAKVFPALKIRDPKIGLLFSPAC